MKKLETLMKRQVTNFGEKESMIVMYACKHWSKEKHKMFVQRRYMVKKMIKYISVYIIEFIFFSYSETENEKQSKIKGY